VDSSSCPIVLFRGVGCTAAVLASSSCRLLSLETDCAIDVRICKLCTLVGNQISSVWKACDRRTSKMPFGRTISEGQRIPRAVHGEGRPRLHGRAELLPPQQGLSRGLRHSEPPRRQHSAKHVQYKFTGDGSLHWP
jgi:hypothetical protein